MRRLIIAAFSSIVFVSILFSFTYTPTVHADGTNGSFILDSVSSNVTDYQLWRFYWGCGIDSHNDALGGTERYPNGTISPGQLDNRGIFAYPENAGNEDAGWKYTRAVRGDMYDNPVADCGDGWIKEPFERFGIKDSFTEFYCKFSEAYNTSTGGLGKTINGGSTAKDCIKGAGIDPTFIQFASKSHPEVAPSGKTIVDETAKFFNQTKRGKNAVDGLNSVERYVQYWRTFSVACSDVVLIDKYPTDSDPAGDNPEVFKIPVVNQNGKLVYYKGVAGSADTDGKSVRLESHVTTTCGKLAIGMRTTAAAYAQYVKAHQDEGGSTVGSDDPEGDGSGSSTTTCNIDGIGWVICPVMNFIAKLNDAAFGFLNNFLNVEPELFTNNGSIAAWKTFRDFANVAFVIAFLALIYSQITGGGLTNYGIKKMLPKLVVAAVLVNVSYFVCQLAVDLSNILGSSIYDLFKNLPVGTGGGSDGSGAWGTIVTTVLAAGTAIGLIALVIFAPTVLLIVGATVVILIARKAIIVILVVISPLAFVAYLLPNTEQWFQKWWKMLWSLLLLFPIIAALFGGGTLASHILSTTASGDDSQMLGIAALAAMALPLLAVPAVLKGALSATGSIGGKISALQDRANSRAKRNIKEGRLGEAKTAFDARRQSRKVYRRLGKGRLAQWGEGRSSVAGRAATWVGTRQKALDNSSIAGYIGADRGRASAYDSYVREFNESVGREQKTMSKLEHPQLMDIVSNKSGRESEERRAAAAGVIGSRSYRDGHLELVEYMGDEKNRDEAMESIQQQYVGDSKALPSVLGDNDRGKLGEGKFSATPRSSGLSIREELMLKRLEEGKISDNSFASFDPDEVKILDSLDTKGVLTGAARDNMEKVIDRLRANPNAYQPTKQAQRNVHDKIYPPTTPPASGGTGTP